MGQSPNEGQSPVTKADEPAGQSHRLKPDGKAEPPTKTTFDPHYRESKPVPLFLSVVLFTWFTCNGGVDRLNPFLDQLRFT